MPKKPLKKIPKLVPLQFGTVYCELCKEQVRAGELVAWWKVPDQGARRRPAVYCKTCHNENIRARQPLQ